MHTDAHRWRAAALVLLLAGVACAQSVRRNGFVSDDAGVLDSASEDQITSILDSLRTRTGYDSCVVTVNSAPNGIETLADSLFASWNDGSLGFIVIVAIRDRTSGIASCQQLEAVLTTTYWDSISERHLKPNFRAENYGAGLVGAVGEISGRIPSRGGTTTTSYPRSGGTSGPGIGSLASPGICTGIGCLVAFLFLIGILNTARRWTPGGWGGGGGYWSRPYGGGGWGGGWGGGHRRSWGGGWGGYRSSGWSSGRSSWGSGGSSFRSSSSSSSNRTTYRGSVHKSSW